MPKIIGSSEHKFAPNEKNEPTHVGCYGRKYYFMSEKHQGFMKALKCRECGREYPLAATHVCEYDFGPLEVAYDYDRIKKALTDLAQLAERANATRRLLVEGGLPDGRFRSVTGNADKDPLLPADPLAAANRRIAILVLRDSHPAQPVAQGH